MRTLFNESQKREYLEYEATINQGVNSITIENYFGRIYNKENEYSKDIADMNMDELKDTISSLKIRRQDSRSHFISIIRGYIVWAKMNNRTQNDSPIDLISSENFSSVDMIRSQMLKDKQQLEEIFDKALDYKCYPNRSTRDELVFWLLYNGMVLEELRNLKKSDIDYKNKKIYCHTGRKYIIDDDNSEIFGLCSECSNMKFIERKRWLAKSFTDDDFIEYELVDNDYLFRTPTPEHRINDLKDADGRFSISSFMGIFKRVLKNYSEDGSFNLTPLNVRNSGIFYRLHLFEKDGNEITPEMLADKFGVRYNPNDKNDLLAKIRRWKIDYEDWKLAFGYM